ncbi:hypothetical protein PVK06_010743 [Gossypium arboreum]|uniref:Uncharacterized protein n=1 Tax=Gossypium arboreum TaxID=29729 RepID=A0ABR0Q838_GOSAR|nr:hypothetical protein PVK06_010743 [Gossypium arboreum]
MWVMHRTSRGKKRCKWDRGPFEVIEQSGREIVNKAKPSVVNQEDSILVKLECEQERDITSCCRDVQTSRMVRVKNRHGDNFAHKNWPEEKPIRLKLGCPDNEDMTT